MKTTRIFAALAAVCALLTGCLKNDVIPQEDDRKYNLSVRVSTGEGTKAEGPVDAAEEEKINTVQVFVFNESGRLETETYANSTDNLNLVCTKGVKKVKVIVNEGQISGIKTLTDLDSKTSYLTNNHTQSLVMVNLTPVTVDVNGPDVSVEVQVKRLVSKIVIKNVHNRLSLTQYKSQPLIVSSIYLINVPAKCSFSEATYYSNEWHNKSCRDDEARNIYNENISYVLQHNGSMTTEHYFYSYPNPNAADSDAQEWSPRHTRLVVECVFDELVYYYPITLPVLQSNTVYTIENLTITRLGLSSPDVIETLGSASFLLDVADWDETTLSDVTI